MKKRFVATGMAMLMALSAVLSGCGAPKKDASKPASEASKAANSGKVKVRMVYWGKEETMQPFLDLAKKKLPNVDVDFQFIAVDQISGIVNAQLQAGEGPDILSNAQEESAVKAGYLLDLTNKDFIKNYSPESIASISVDGKVYGVPGIGWFEGMFYNKDIFNKYGLKPPKTFADLMNIHKVLKKNGVKPQTIGANSWEPLVKSTLGLGLNDWIMASEKGKAFDKSIRNGTGKFEGSGLKNVIKTWSQYIKDGYITPDMLEVSYDDALKEFATGKAAMWQSGPWAVKTIQETNPKLKFDMFPFVGTKPGEGWLIGGPGVVFGVNAKSKHQKEALDVIALMATEEGQKALWEGNKGGSSYLKGMELKLPEMFDGVANVLKDNRVYCPWFVWGEGNISYIETYGKGLQEYLQGTKKIDTILKEVDQKVAAEHAQK